MAGRKPNRAYPAGKRRSRTGAAAVVFLALVVYVVVTITGAMGFGRFELTVWDPT